MPEAEASVSERGAPLWFHAWDDSRPVPQYMDSVAQPDGSYITVYRDKIPPRVIKAAFESKVAADIHRQGELQTQNKLAWFVIPALILVVVLIAGVLWFDWNSFCATHASQCGGVP